MRELFDRMLGLQEASYMEKVPDAQLWRLAKKIGGHGVGYISVGRGLLLIPDDHGNKRNWPVVKAVEKAGYDVVSFHEVTREVYGDRPTGETETAIGLLLRKREIGGGAGVRGR